MIATDTGEHKLRQALLHAAALSLSCVVGGCAPQSSTSSAQGPLLTGQPGAGQGIPGVIDRPVARPGGVSQSTHVRTAVMPLGAVPYDNLSLPLVSPNGQYVVTQSGFPPTWPTLRAESRAEPPIDTRLHLYRIDYTPSERGIGGIMLQSSINEPVLLGRACNDEGFLVESPRSDGSRWIGLCRWIDGEIAWLVTGIDVNAFATINRHGDLAWCRRSTGSDHFELVVRGAGQIEMTLATAGEDWLMPFFAAQRDRLFAFHLRGGRLAATYHSLSSPATLERPLFRVELAVQATVDAAYQCMAPSPASSALPSVGNDRLVFFHPVHARTVLWQPMELPERQVIIVPGDSIAALVDGSRYALVTTSEHLVRQNLMEPDDKQEIIKGLLIARPTTNSDWPYVLLSPSRPGQIGMTALNLLPLGN